MKCLTLTSADAKPERLTSLARYSTVNTAKQRANWEIIGDGHGVHWPDIDEDISGEGMLFGIPAPRPQASSKVSLKSTKKKPMANKGMQRISKKAGAR